MARSLAPSPIASVAPGATPYRCLQLDQRGELGLAAEDRLGHLPGQPFAGIDEQCVGAVLVEADHGGDALGEQREAAGDQAGAGAVLRRVATSVRAPGVRLIRSAMTSSTTAAGKPASSATRSRSAGATPTA